MSSTGAPTKSSEGVVADASAIIAVVVGGAAPVLQDRLFEREIRIYAPAIIDLEVLNALRRYVLFRELNLADAAEAIARFAAIHISRFAHDPFFYRIWDLRANLTAYDAAYVALAEAMNVPLITLDARLARACPPTIRVELFA